MPSYQNIAIDEASFLEFVARPEGDKLHRFVSQLSANDQANSFFEYAPPAWYGNTMNWVAERFSFPDWYEGFSEAEMVAWQHAMMFLLDEGHFECDRTKIDFMKHGTVNFDVFEFAEIIFGEKDVESQVARMYPYRFRCLSPEIEAVEPMDRVFEINHALLATNQLRKLIEELSNYSELLSGFMPSFPAVFESSEARRDSAISEAEDLIVFLSSLVDNNYMWYARIDC